MLPSNCNGVKVNRFVNDVTQQGALRSEHGPSGQFVAARHGRRSFPSSGFRSQDTSHVIICTFCERVLRTMRYTFSTSPVNIYLITIAFARNPLIRFATINSFAVHLRFFGFGRFNFVTVSRPFLPRQFDIGWKSSRHSHFIRIHFRNNRRVAAWNRPHIVKKMYAFDKAARSSMHESSQDQCLSHMMKARVKAFDTLGRVGWCCSWQKWRLQCDTDRLPSENTYMVCDS